MRNWNTELLPSSSMAGRLGVAACLALALAVLPASPSHAQRDQDGPFEALPGSWSGSGTIAMSNGTKERIRCQGQYRLESRASIRLQLNCSSDSYRFELQSTTVSDNGSLSGIWSERTRGVAGKIFGRISGSRMNIRAEGQTFSALLDMTTRGNRQSISIRSPGSEMQEVKISLARRSR